tara:strand:- start:105 stop:302 length:198 start_codon:yes stop_codon:yes gene_type:complete
MTAEEIKDQADIKRSEAKTAIAKLMGLGVNIQSELANKAVDDLVICLILEITAMQAKAGEKFSQR